MESRKNTDYIFVSKSGFFFNVLTRSLKVRTFSLNDSRSAGFIHIKMQDGSMVSIGDAYDTLRGLKHRVEDKHDI